MKKLRRTIYFSEDTWELLQQYIYRYGWNSKSNSDNVDYIVKSYLTAEKKRLYPGG